MVLIYQETFAFAKRNSVQVLLSCAANLEWTIQLLDVTNAFLHRDLKEEVYMEVTSGFSNESSKEGYLNLKSSIWSKTISTSMV